MTTKAAAGPFRVSNSKLYDQDDTQRASSLIHRAAASHPGIQISSLHSILKT